jgi:hypothetical protein
MMIHAHTRTHTHTHTLPGVLRGLLVQYEHKSTCHWKYRALLYTEVLLPLPSVWRVFRSV